MKNLLVIVVQIILIFGIFSTNKCDGLQDYPDYRDEDAIMFESDGYSPQSRSIGQGVYSPDNMIIPSIDNRHIIDPPPRPNCKPCYKSDPRGKCRRIIGCEE